MREAHRGCRSGQSEHTWFSGRAIRALRRFLSCCWEAMVVWFVWEYLLLAAEQCGWIGRRVRVPGAVFSRSLRTRFMARDVLLLHRMRSCPKMHADGLRDCSLNANAMRLLLRSNVIDTRYDDTTRSTLASTSAVGRSRMINFIRTRILFNVRRRDGCPSVDRRMAIRRDDETADHCQRAQAGEHWEDQPSMLAAESLACRLLRHARLPAGANAVVQLLPCRRNKHGIGAAVGAAALARPPASRHLSSMGLGTSVYRSWGIFDTGGIGFLTCNGSVRELSSSTHSSLLGDDGFDPFITHHNAEDADRADRMVRDYVTRRLAGGAAVKIRKDFVGGALNSYRVLSERAAEQARKGKNQK